MTGAEQGAADHASVAPQYEALRSAALGGVLPPEARSGLTLFLRRGMWGWARAIGTTGASPQPTRSTSNWTAPEGYRAVIHVLAAMAIQADNRGATP